MQIPTYFSIFPESQIGQVYGTEFTFVADLPVRYTKFAWDFGDRSGISYDVETTSHTYNYPGIYTVQLSSWTNDGDLYVDWATIDVDYVYRDSVLFTQIPDTYGIPGIASYQSFIVSLTSAKIDQDLSLVLQSFNSQSVPHYAIPEKWRFITPTWRFTEADGTVLNGPLILPRTPVYNEEGKIVAIKAEKAFYYIDDLSTGLDPDKDCPLMIVATLSTERFYYPPESLIYPYASYSNSEVARAVISWQINDVIPTNFKVTENYLNEIYPIKWANVPIPVMLTLESNSKLKADYVETATEGYRTIALSYPRTNEIGAGNEVALSLSSSMFALSAGVHYRVDEAPLHFKASDEYGNVASGYIFTTITPLSSFPGNTVISVSATVVNQSDDLHAFAFPIGYPIQPHVYISHPAKNTINKLNVSNAPVDCPAINQYKDLGILVEGSLSFITAPSAESLSVTTLSGTGVYAMSFNPNVNRLYTADMDLNTINCYFAGSTLLSTIDLEKMFSTTNLGPAYISIDRKNNIWVSLFDNMAVLKFDSNLNYLLSAVPLRTYNTVIEPQVTEEEYLLDENDGFMQVQNRYEEEAGLHPPVVETDRENNIWVCYPNDVYSVLYKLSSTGETLIQAGGLPLNSFPVSMSIDADNSVWVACKRTDNILNFSTEGTLVKSITGVLAPSYISQDRSGNMCILHGYNLFSVCDANTLELSTWRIQTTGGGEDYAQGSIELVKEYTPEDIAKAYTEDEIWGGLCTDVYNRVWIVDSVYNNVMSFKPFDVNNYTINQVLPGGDYKVYFISGDSYTPYIGERATNVTRSAQAGGDWSGNRWYQKYGAGTNSVPIQGVSAPFTVYDIDNSFNITKINESFSYAQHFKDLAFPEVLQQSTSLFEFLSAAVGDGNPLRESLGGVVYEKIANFVENKGDYETADVDTLLSICEQMGVDYKIYDRNMPTAINRLINLFSIHKNRLRGIPNYETDISKNIRSVITETMLITANRFYLAKNKKNTDSTLVWANEQKGLSIYPLSYLQSPVLKAPVTDNYYIFEYDSQNINDEFPYTGNLIDWKTPLSGEDLSFVNFNAISHVNTLMYSMSSNEEWYGDKGIIETMFNNLLTKQLYQQ